MELEEDMKERKKTIDFQVGPQHANGDEGDGLAESMTLPKNFNQVARKRNRRFRGTFQTKNMTYASSPFNASHKVNINPKGNPNVKNRYKGIQYREREGYGHI